MSIKSVIAANRFGLGARPGDLQRINRNPETWLLDQLQGPSAQPPQLKALPSSATVLRQVSELRRERKMAKGEASAGEIKKYGRTVLGHYIGHITTRYSLAATTNTPFYERLVHFWSNHFAVSTDKHPMAAIAGLYEHEAIRPNISGKFADLLIAAEQHPAMILYLDNQRSVGPGSAHGRRANRAQNNRNIGLNENLAREILELHTLGVEGGYSQEDVTTFAKVITGWSIGGSTKRGRFAEGNPGEFHFHEMIHEPGTHQVLGRSYSQSGVAQGEAVLRDLAIHPATARFLATKLARHFVADSPDPELVAHLANTYLDSGGDLGAVYKTLVTAPAAMAVPYAKYKTPHDFVISTLRAFDHTPDNPRFIISALDLMGQTPFRPESPAGWPDTAEEWGGADALYKRIEWSNRVARVIGTRSGPVELGDAVLGTAFSAHTRKAISRAESSVQGTTLLLASPDFQRR